MSDKYDLAVGSSFGSTILLALLPLMRARPNRVVLGDPVIDIDLSRFPKQKIEIMANCRENTPSEDELLAANKLWTRNDAIIKRFGALNTHPAAVFSLFDVRNSSHG